MTPSQLYSYEKELRGRGDITFLKFCFEKLSLNFTWWVNRKDEDGNNVFAGGFLGLDNIGVFDRSSALPTGGCLEQSDGTAWMAFFASMMLQIAVELAIEDDPHYEAMALKYFEHFLWIAAAMDNRSFTGSSCGTTPTASTTMSCVFPTAAASVSKCAPWSG